MTSVLESAEGSNAVLIGPGMRDVPLIEALLPELLSLAALNALIIDATALRVAAPLLTEARKRGAPVILTPHQGEMQEMASRSGRLSLTKSQSTKARVAATKFNAVMVLKGAETIICDQEGEAFVNKRGNAGLGTAGSGDVLAGIIAGLATRGADPMTAAMWGVSSHARAGETLAKVMAPIGYLASDLLNHIPRMLK